MSKPRPMARANRARLGYYAGLLLLAAGLGWFVHPGLGVAVAGAGMMAWSVLLYDVDEEPPVQEDGPW
jgi:amino acid transporter